MKKFIISFSFFILSSTVFATSVGNSIGGWQVVSQVANGIGQKLTATKNVMVNGASKVVTGTANLTPNPGNMARFMAKAGGAAVVINAMDLVLDGVDYVMDPVNNTVSYKDKNSQADEKYTSPYLYVSIDQSFITAYSLEDLARKSHVYLANTHSSYSGTTFSSINYIDTNEHQDSYIDYTFKYQNGHTNTWGTSARRTLNPDYDPAYEGERRVVPISDVSSQVLDQAEADIRAGNPASPAVALSRAVAQDMAAEAETDDVKARPIAQQFDQNQSVPTQEDSTGTIDRPEVVDPVTGEVIKPAESASVSLKWPKACEWFPTLCMFIDWMQKPHELDEPNLPKEELEKKEIEEDLITVNASHCPAPILVNIPLPVFNTTYSDAIDITEYCPKIKDLAPVLQLLAFVLAVMIIREI
ncbi:hypothetical protein IL972_09860 [Acinetobacter sp. FL51]|uniref:hypothetical protein n=1 Tax=Acinetobacter sp. FL51 TaxID=2777978 RepID=UPI0018E0D01D|nr:hypothetical protein [Acinetobacter sp. FL51]MBI1452210.1 hypothetical protein [Acinetobacter sp. FL51]